MLNLLIIAEKKDAVTELSSGLTRNGYSCPVVSEENEVVTQLAKQTPDVILVATRDYHRMQELSQRVKQGKALPVIALVTRDALDIMNVPYNICVEPAD